MHWHISLRLIGIHSVNAISHSVDHVEFGHRIHKLRIAVFGRRLVACDVILRLAVKEVSTILKRKPINVFSDNNPTVASVLYDRPNQAITTGVGLKITIPGVGPLSVDYGIPLTKCGPNGNKNGYFTFGVGDMMY